MEPAPARPIAVPAAHQTAAYEDQLRVRAQWRRDDHRHHRGRTPSSGVPDRRHRPSTHRQGSLMAHKAAAPDPLTAVLIDLLTIDREIGDTIARLARHERCLRRCQAWRDRTAELDTLLDLRLRFMDR